MNYESPEERIERLENQVAGLIKAIVILSESAGSSIKLAAKVCAVLADQDMRLANANLDSLKFVVENSSGFTEPLRQAMLAVIAEAEKNAASLPSVVVELEKQFKPPVLPEDLFGPGPQKWPPQNPPDKPLGS